MPSDLNFSEKNWCLGSIQFGSREKAIYHLPADKKNHEGLISCPTLILFFGFSFFIAN
jgi:hypothetical protein